MRSKPLLLSAVAATVFVLAACGGSSPDEGSAGQGGSAAVTGGGTGAGAASFARPAVLADLPFVTLEAPAALDAGPTPIFRWASIDGAASYRLLVRGPGGEGWAWRGAETSIRYGGGTDGVPGPQLVPGMVWSVAALDGDGRLVALSELRAVSPTSEPGPIEAAVAGGVNAAVAVTSGGATGAGSAGAGQSGGPAEPAASAAASVEGPCGLLTAEEITAAIGGDWAEPISGDVVGNTGSCEWQSAKGTLMTIWILAAEHHDPDGWGADETIDGLGEGAYAVTHGWDRRIGWVQSDVSVMLVTDFTNIKPEAFLGIATMIDERLP